MPTTAVKLRGGLLGPPSTAAAPPSGGLIELQTYTGPSAPATDLHIYNLDTVPPTDVVWNDVATDKLTTQDGDKFRTGAGVVADVRATPHRLTPVLPCHTT